MAEKVTLSVIKADVGSVAGHSCPHPSMIKKARGIMDSGVKSKVISDYHISRAGDDIELIMTHRSGENAKEVHQLGMERIRRCGGRSEEAEALRRGPGPAFRCLLR